MIGPETLTIGERIVVHLSQFTRQQDDYVCPLGMSQAGIAMSLGITRAHAAIELKRAMGVGRVETRIAHVTGEPTRRKVYRLTRKGQSVAQSVRRRVLARIVEVVLPNGRPQALPGPRALEVLRRAGVGEGRAVLLVITRSQIDLREPGTRRRLPTSDRRTVNVEARARATFDRAFLRPVAWQFEVIQGPPNAPPFPAAA